MDRLAACIRAWDGTPVAQLVGVGKRRLKKQAAQPGQSPVRPDGDGFEDHLIDTLAAFGLERIGQGEHETHCPTLLLGHQGQFPVQKRLDPAIHGHEFLALDGRVEKIFPETFNTQLENPVQFPIQVIRVDAADANALVFHAPGDLFRARILVI